MDDEMVSILNKHANLIGLIDPSDTDTEKITRSFQPLFTALLFLPLNFSYLLRRLQSIE